MVARKGTIKAKVEMDPTYKVPRRSTRSMSRRRTEIRARLPRRSEEAADDFQINPDLSGLRFTRSRSRCWGATPCFNSSTAADRSPGHGSAWISTRPARSTTCRATSSRIRSCKAKAPAELAASGIAKEEAIAKALTATGSTGDSPHTIHSTEQVAYPVDGQPTPAWKVGRRRQAMGEWKVYVDAASGAVLGVVSLLKEARGRIFDPHPVATLNDTTLEDSSTPSRPTPRSSWSAWTAPGTSMGHSSVR